MNTRFWHRNASTILTCVGSAGVVTTAILAAKATPKATKLIDEAKEEKGEELSKWEVVKTVGKVYIPTVITGTATIGCIFGANVLNKNHQAALVSAYGLIDSSYKQYRRKLKELYGEDAHNEIVEAIAAEKTDKVHVYGGYLGTFCDLSVEETDREPRLFYDEYEQRYFEATIEQVLVAEYHLNRNYILRGWAVLNELYEFLGLEPTDFGSVAGWAPLDEGMYWIDFNHRKAWRKDGTEYYILEIPFEPTVDYEEY